MPETSSGSQNGPLAVTFYDGLSRTIATDVEGFDGSGTGCTTSAPCWNRVATQYDANGRPHQTSRPYFVASGTPKWTVNTTYDALGRVTLVTFPDASTLTTTFCGLTTSVTNALGQPAQTYEAATSTCGASGSLTSYTYDAFGDLLTVVDPASNTVANNTYDIRGRKTQSIDADMRTWTYVYDGYGELYSQTDAKSQVSTLTYDALGRVLTHAESGLTSAYAYDTASGKGVGQPATASSQTLWLNFSWGSANWSSGGYARTFAYDSLGRPSTLALTEDGSVGVYTLGYDANGRLQTVAYPSGFTAKYAYTATGYLYQISDNAAGTVFWTANTQHAELHLLTQTQGDGVTTTQASIPTSAWCSRSWRGPGRASPTRPSHSTPWGGSRPAPG
jgi:YD repeat-containing protein